MKMYLVLFAVLFTLPLGEALADNDNYPRSCNDDYFFSTGHNSGTPEEFENAVNNGDPGRIWFVFTALCILSPNFDIEITRSSMKVARNKTWDEIFALTGIDQNLIHHKDQTQWINRIRETSGFTAGFYITSEQLLKLKASGLVATVEYVKSYSN